MNVVFSSDKKEYNTIKKGTEILLKGRFQPKHRIVC